MSFAKPTFPIRVSPSGTGFIDAAGKPFFWMGDTAWPLLSRYSKDEARAYVSRRAAQGFNVIQTVFTWGDPQGKQYEDVHPAPNPDDELPWSGTPPVANARYFDWAEELLTHAEREGVALLVIGLWGNYVVEQKLFDAAATEAFARYLGDRFKGAKNLLWMNGGDRLPMGYEDVWRGYAKGVREAGATQLMTYHPTGAFASSYFWHDAPWLDFNFTQTWGSWQRIYAITLADRLLQPPKPTVLGEPAYEDGPEYPTGPITPNLVRKQACWAYFAGGGFTYGQNQSWRMEPGWSDAIESPGAIDMGRIRTILEARHWHEMTPDNAVLYDGNGAARSLRAAMKTRDRKHWLIYLPEPGVVNICIDRVAAANVRATWIDLRTGNEVDGGVHETTNERGIVFPSFEDVRSLKSPRFFDDCILALDAVL